jgi:hypothetical protein
VINRREENGIIGYEDNGPATGEVSDDFVFLGAGRETRWKCGQQNQGDADKAVLHGGRVAQRADCGLAGSSGMVPEWSRIR